VRPANMRPAYMRRPEMHPAAACPKLIPPAVPVKPAAMAGKASEVSATTAMSAKASEVSATTMPAATAAAVSPASPRDWAGQWLECARDCVSGLTVKTRSHTSSVNQPAAFTASKP
jgi:hypothetical protein